MIVYKVDVLEMLKNAGYSSYRLRKEKIIGESMMQKIRSGELMSWETLSRVCDLLNCQPGDILEFIKEKPEG
jgi:putative transcriptional regulator